MASKDPVINLVDFRHLAGNVPAFDAEQQFRVDTLKNSVLYRAGQYVTEQVVQDLINTGWTVNIRAPRNADF